MDVGAPTDVSVALNEQRVSPLGHAIAELNDPGATAPPLIVIAGAVVSATEPGAGAGAGAGAGRPGTKVAS